MKNNSKKITVVLAGINGYGHIYLDPLLDRANELGVELVGVIDPEASRNERFGELEKAGIPSFDSLKEFYKTNTAQLVVISAPIHHHLPLTREAINNGSNVLCEKPLAATAEEAEEFKQLDEQSSQFIAVGYQWSFSNAVQNLKRDILKGDLGTPKKYRTLCLWPRPHSYYSRNNWAGRIKTDSGSWVLDSPANNATAHFLHNMLYLQGTEIKTSALPVSINDKLYRANNIENYDSAAIHVKTDRDADIFFYTTHAVRDKRGPIFHLEFDNADVYYDMEKDPVIRARFRDGSERVYGNPGENNLKKLEDAINSVRGEKDIVCGVEAAMAQTICIHKMQKESTIQPIPPQYIHCDETDNGDTLTWVDGLGESFKHAYENYSLPEGEMLN